MPGEPILLVADDPISEEVAHAVRPILPLGDGPNSEEVALAR